MSMTAPAPTLEDMRGSNVFSVIWEKVLCEHESREAMPHTALSWLTRAKRLC